MEINKCKLNPRQGKGENDKDKNKNQSNRKQNNKKRKSINQTWFFEKISKIGKPLVRITKKKYEYTYINKIRNERKHLITDSSEIKRILRDYYNII